MEKIKISVLMSLYVKEKASNFKECMESILAQTYPADEIVVVKDGPLNDELEQTLACYVKKYPDLMRVVASEENLGLGRALSLGTSECSNEIIARMDTDDICVPDRFEKQIKCFEEDKDLSIVGSDISEFTGDISNVVSRRTVPQEHKEICEYLKSRCPFNHMTVMFKKSEVEKAGGYLHWHYNEDSYLWVRMYLAGCKFRNIGESLVYARINTDTFKRRGGYKYYKSERDLFRFMKDNKVITFGQYLKAKFIRFVVQVLMPNGVRQWFFKKFARS